MGMGKSEVITPIILSQVSMYGFLPIIVYPDELHTSATRHVESVLAKLRMNRVEVLKVSRSAGEEGLQRAGELVTSWKDLSIEKQKAVEIQAGDDTTSKS